MDEENKQIVHSGVKTCYNGDQCQDGTDESINIRKQGSDPVSTPSLKYVVDRQNHSVLTCLTLISTSLSTGSLGIPFGVLQSGWIGVACILLIALVYGYTGKLVIKCIYEKSKMFEVAHRTRASYQEIAEAAYGRGFKVVVEVIESIAIFGATTLYIILLGDTLSGFIGKNLGFGFNESAAIVCAASLPFLMIKRVSIISLCSAVAGMMSTSAIILLVVYCFLEVKAWKIANVPVFPIWTFPLGFGVIAFSFGGHVTFPAVEGSMKTPEKFGFVVFVTFIFVGFIKVALGLFMVMVFGTKTDQVATINIADQPTFKVVVTCLVSLTAFLTLPLLMLVVSSVFDDVLLPHFPHMNKQSRHFWLWILLTRPMLLSTMLLAAILVPQFGLVMGLFGSLCSTCLSIIFPCVFYMKLKWIHISRGEVLFCVFLILFGVVVGVVGVASSIQAIIRAL